MTVGTYERILEAVAERHDLDLEVDPSSLHGFSALAGTPGEWIVKTTGAESREEACAALYDALSRRDLPGCRDCLGASVVHDEGGVVVCCPGCYDAEPSDSHPSDRIVAEAAARSLK